jgi:asparagine synthase (glutamine-hydrolysing)
MVSESGRFVISYNGEIYNHAELRAELSHRRALPWRGHSDTEVLLEAIDQWGVRRALERTNGMFAFALWDRHDRTLTLARDRLGEKPLYVGKVGGGVAFASEMKALRCLPDWRHAVDRDALGIFLRFGYVPAPLSIHPGIFKLPAASYLTLSANDASASMGLSEFVVRTERYWDLSRIAAAGIAEPFSGTEEEAVHALDTLLADSVRMRMEADVPVGAMLSGGIDSSLVAALMQRQTSRPVRTFTVGFQDGRFDEAPHASQIAGHLGTEHTEFHLTPAHALEVIPRLPEIYDEPFADPSQIPSILISEIARRNVTVALSGDGGDELYFGYGRYFNAMRIWRRIGGWRSGARTGLAGALRGAGRLGGRHGFRLRRLGGRMAAATFEEFYANLLSLALTRTAIGSWPRGLPEAPVLPPIPAQLHDPARQMMIVDQCMYLPEDILSKVDRASMAASLEMRVPLLDHRAVEFAWRLPMNLLVQGGTGKRVLRTLLYRYVPRKLVDRPKHGFEIPVDDWLRGPLRVWLRDLLDPARISDEGYLDAGAVSGMVAEHLDGRADHGYALWPVLMFQAWQRRYG